MEKLEEYKNKIEKSIPSVEERLNEYIESFETDLETSLNINYKKYPILYRIYNEALQEYKTSHCYKSLLHEVIKLENESELIFSDEQKLLLNKLKFLTDLMQDYTMEQIFILGFCIAKQIENEEQKNNLFNTLSK